MSLWQYAVQTALVGSERQLPNLPLIEGELGNLLAKLDSTDPEGMLLGAAALIALYQRAGKVLEQTTEEINPGDLDNLPQCSHKANQYLQKMLDGECQEFLPEWLCAVQASGKRVPEQSLPALLELGRKTPHLRSAILPILGKRGYWLAAQNPVWNYAIAVPDESTWETDSNDGRIWLLKCLRVENPLGAWELVVSTWDKDKADDRAAYLATFEIGLSMEDEPFLEDVLDDRSQEVHRVAADLLARLPYSRLCKRSLQRVRPLVQFTRGKTLEVKVCLPESGDKAMFRDGIELNSYSKMGEKAWWLQQILGAVPLTYWCQTFDMKHKELIQAAIASDWKQELLEGWAEAAKRQQNFDWAAALLKETIQEKVKYSSYSDFKKGLIEQLPNIKKGLIDTLPHNLRETVVLRLLRHNCDYFRYERYESLALDLLSQCQHPWSIELTRAFINMLRQKRSWYKSYSMNPLKEVINYIDPSLIQELASCLGPALDGSDFAKSVKKSLTSLQFRYNMLKVI